MNGLSRGVDGCREKLVLRVALLHSSIECFLLLLGVVNGVLHSLSGGGRVVHPSRQLLRFQRCGGSRIASVLGRLVDRPDGASGGDCSRPQL